MGTRAQLPRQRVPAEGGGDGPAAPSRPILPRWLPRGAVLDDQAWQRRHRAVVVLLALHAPGLVAFALFRGESAWLLALSAVAPALTAAVALWSRPPKTVRAAVAAAGLMIASALVVLLAGGAITAHFHFFVMIPVIALYQQWTPFCLGVGFVLVEHGLVGTLWPARVYSDHAAVHHPWGFAAVHAGYVAAACLGTLVQWRLAEQARAAELRMSRLVAERARQDQTTGLRNRVALLEDAPDLLAGAGAAGQGVAVLVLDLDRFKDVNDTLGHDHGDLLLVHVARCLRDRLRPSDRLFRLGGDEFAVIMPGVDEAEAVTVAGRLRRTLLTEHVTLAGVDVPVDASVGVALEDAAGTAPGDYPAAMSSLLRQAEVAMYTAKADRRGVAVYDPGQDSNTRGRLSLLADLRQAVESEHLMLYFQPKVRISDGAFVGTEALVRWQHPVLGMVPPMDFIPLAEATNLIVPLTHRMIRLALTHVRDWAEAGVDVPVAVNVSPRSVIEGDLPQLVRETLGTLGVPPHLLRLEITETTLVTDPERALVVLRALNDLGVGISLDDFGTGYSSLSYLKHLPVDELKIDQSFVGGLLNQDEDEVLVRATIDLGHNLGMSVVAEGVENEETVAALRDLGCDLAQGYHFARPLPAHELRPWLERHSAEASAASR